MFNKIKFKKVMENFNEQNQEPKNEVQVEEVATCENTSNKNNLGWVIGGTTVVVALLSTVGYIWWKKKKAGKKEAAKPEQPANDKEVKEEK